jgi:hypothetical protein
MGKQMVKFTIFYINPMPRALLISLTAFLLFIACDDKPKTQAVSNENKDTIVMDSMFEKNKDGVESTGTVSSLENVAEIKLSENKDAVAIENCLENATEIKLSENKVVFTTKDLKKTAWPKRNDLENATWISPDKYPLKSIGHDGKIYDNKDYLLKLPNYKNFEIVIWLGEGADNIPYALCIVKSGIIMALDKSLDITPDWSDPEDYDNVYCRKTFKIYDDYTIEIYTEEKGYTDERDEDGNFKYGKAQKYTKYYRINDNGDFCEVILK